MEKPLIHKKRKSNGGKQFGYNNSRSTPVASSRGIPASTAEKLIKDSSKGIFNYNVINNCRLIDIEYKTPPKAEREAMREKFKEVRAEFLKYIANNKTEELRAIGINDEGLEYMRQGRSVKGYNIHHKLPIAGGGKNVFSNLIIMPQSQHDELHHLILDPQIRNRSTSSGIKIKLPWSDEMVWKRPEKALDNVAKIEPPLYMQAEKSNQGAETKITNIAKVLQKQTGR